MKSLPHQSKVKDMNLVIGTANLTQDYGRDSRRLAKDQFLLIVEREKKQMGFAVDTSPDYGNAEFVCEGLKDDFVQVFSKVRYLRETGSFATSVLRDGNFKKVLIHNWEELSQTERVKALKILEAHKLEGRVSGFGFSTYETFCDFELLSAFKELYIQAPVSVLNQSNLEKISQIKDEFPNTTILARSIFLQGLLLKEFQSESSEEHPHLARFKSFCQELGRTPIEMALEFLLVQKSIDGLVVGVDSVQNWENITNIVRSPRSRELERVDWSSLKSSEMDLIDPRRWF